MHAFTFFKTEFLIFVILHRMEVTTDQKQMHKRNSCFLWHDKSNPVFYQVCPNLNLNNTFFAYLKSKQGN